MTAKKLEQRARLCLDRSGQHGSKLERCLLLYSRLQGYTDEEVDLKATRTRLDGLIRGMGETAWSGLGNIIKVYGEDRCTELLAYVAGLGARDTQKMVKQLNSSGKRRKA